MSNNGSKNNPFKQSFAPCPQPATDNIPAGCYEPQISQQTPRETNPFKSVVESEFTYNSEFDAPYLIQSTPANVNYYPQAVYKDIIAKLMSQNMSPINRYDLSSDSGEKCSSPRERIYTLRPGQFDGSTSWSEFLNRFEDCDRANHWSERTMTVQMRFCLVGAAGSVINKNPRSGRWEMARHPRLRPKPFRMESKPHQLRFNKVHHNMS